MSSRSTGDSPWPAQTPLPPSSPSSHAGKRKRSGREGRFRPAKIPRATIANQSEIDQAKAQCIDSDNSVISCWPTGDTTLDQNMATQFVWNSNQPLFAKFDLVDIFLHRADTGDIISTYKNVANPRGIAGFLPVTASDPWWGSSGEDWPGTPVAFPFYFVIVGNGSSTGTASPQSTFTAIQTTFANSVLSSMSLTSALASSSSAAAASSRSAASLSSLTAVPSDSGSRGTGTDASGQASNTNGAGGLQNAGATSSFPHWAIAVIVVLGFFALAAFVAFLFLAFTRMRRRNGDSRRGSMNSQSPMMRNAESGEPASPLMGGTSTYGQEAVGAAAVGGSVAMDRAASTVSPDGASANSETPFSGADAAVMAEAFRKALRKPDFADRPMEEGESPEAALEEGERPGLINRELAEEGRDIRSVGSSRGVRVETLGSDDGDTTTARDSQV